MSTFGERLLQRRTEMKMSQDDLAKKTGVSRVTISKIELGESQDTRSANLFKISEALGCSPEWLLTGKNGESKDTAKLDSNVSDPKPYRPSPKYPVLSWVQAGAWNEACEAYTLNEIDEWYESEIGIQGAAFWLKVEGDSMTAPIGPSIPDGSLVLVDTGREPVNGSLVIAKLTDSNEATFKKLIIDGSSHFLKGLNPAWPLMAVNGNCKIIGVVVQMMMRFV
ncbi:TPA: helix-turn-helix domain-containing protein [Morganella morganii]|uniref:LexA family protein n=2 Tax=Morganella morganii TaxID=582 RepID=UPI0004677F88|nr:S24 family peptidase [Morganella morganii]MBX9344048.1 helix-turn-helix domain-containing protein [Morganella morganii]MBX9368767.1 helix-turn-helix domain-containing protein [Morganella morganii]HBC7441665.1 helix-turn-helix domain-containing protein [Morganella morganii]HBH7053933.1 helix-turn-helix domain-containing protein [Morganella morganii]HBN5914270.1 helix-turn-helix domain-containing protein [Morganella morganii]